MHSTFSDGKLTIPELIDLYGGLGFGAIAITDHLCETQTVMGQAAHYLDKTLTSASFPLYMETLRSEAERAWHRYRMVVIPGVELTKNSISNHRSAHILGLGIQNFIPADGEVVELARAIRAQGGLAIAAHPVHTRKTEKQTYHLWDNRKVLAKEIDAWEVASGQHLFHEVLESGLPMLANSDLHRREQLSSWKTVLHCERRMDAIFDSIREQRIEIVYYGEDSPISARMRSRSTRDGLTNSTAKD